MKAMADLSKMKVADLKKHLKDRGLAVTGNKNELVERLFLSLQSGAVEEEEFDEDAILGGDVSDFKISQEEEAAALAGTIKLKDTSLAATNGVDEKKKVSLKRAEVSVPEQTTNAADKENAAADAPNEPKHKAIKLDEPVDKEASETTKKALTDEERKRQRSERFALSLSSNSSANANSRPAKLSKETGGIDMEKLKKRAERFGMVTSKTLTKAEEDEKKKQRQGRFAESGAAETAVTENGSASNKTQITSPVEDAESLKAKRAERFAS